MNEAKNMEMNVKSADRNLLLEISGELDHHGARDAIAELERAIDAAACVIEHGCQRAMNDFN